MSVCISKNGEYSSHEPDGDHVCTLCGVLDEDGLIAELREVKARIAELERQRDAVLALCELDDLRLRDTVGPYAIDLAQEIRKIFGGGQ